MRALLVPVGDDTYAIELSEVREVVASPVVTEVPTAPSSVLGVFNLRGEVIVLLDSGVLLGTDAVQEIRNVVVLETRLGVAALPATDSTRTVELGDRIGDSRTPGGRGRYRAGETAVTLLDLDAVVTAVGGNAS